MARHDPGAGDGLGCVAAGHALTAQAAADILRLGGNAFDAAIAALAMGCVAEPILTSPGGGGFLMARTAAGAVTLLDFFPMTPQRKRPETALDFCSIHADFGTATQEFHIGRAAAAVPGLVPGLLAAHADFATLPLKTLLAPAIEAARTGWRLNRFEAYLMGILRPILTNSPGTRALFATGGDLPGAGERFANPALGEFWQGLAEGGEGFYRSGEMLGALLEGQAQGGHLGEADLAAYRVERRAALEMGMSGGTGEAGGTGGRIFLNPPPSAGGAYVACTLKAFAGAATVCHETVMRGLSHADALRRRHGGDLDAVLAAAGLAGHGVRAGPPAVRGTTHISIIDKAGNAAALTSSNGEGNGHAAGRFGFMLNNMLGEEDLNPSGFHRWQENTRMSSMMCPAVIAHQDGAVTALGSGGSNRIRTAMAQAIARLMIDGAAPEAAVTAPRLHIENGALDFEDFFGTEARRDIESRYREARAWGERNLFFGGVHMAGRANDGRFHGAGDARRMGVFIAV